MSNTIFVIAMNQAKYDSLPPDLKKVIDANSGLEWSKQIGKIFDSTTARGNQLAEDADGVFDTLSPAEYDAWEKAGDGVVKEWIGDVNAKGANGQQMLQRSEGADQEVRRLTAPTASGWTAGASARAPEH